MSGAGAPKVTVDGTGLRVVGVAASWPEQVMDGLLAGARRALAESGAAWTEVRVPGSLTRPTAP